MKKLILIFLFIPLFCFGQTNQATAYAYYRNGMDKYNNREYIQARKNFYEASKYYVWPQLKYAYGISLYLTGEKRMVANIFQKPQGRFDDWFKLGKSLFRKFA